MKHVYLNPFPFPSRRHHTLHVLAAKLRCFHFPENQGSLPSRSTADLPRDTEGRIHDLTNLKAGQAQVGYAHLFHYGSIFPFTPAESAGRENSLCTTI